jgi:hypothetical protein
MQLDYRLDDRYPEAAKEILRTPSVWTSFVVAPPSVLKLMSETASHELRELSQSSA